MGMREKEERAGGRRRRWREEEGGKVGVGVEERKDKRG